MPLDNRSGQGMTGGVSELYFPFRIKNLFIFISCDGPHDGVKMASILAVTKNGVQLQGAKQIEHVALYHCRAISS